MARAQGAARERVAFRRKLARLKESGNLGWSVAAFLISLIALLPLLAIALIALKPSGDTWPHLIANVLPGALRRTLLLMAGVGSLSLLIGTGTAWLVTMYRFPGRRYLQWLLLLPLAIPTYIIAYTYLEMLDYSGMVQTALRGLFGWRNARDYWFPDIRSLGGAILVMSAVLYPYVYITARASFIAQSVCVLEVSRTLGRNAAETFWQVALPLARPALAAGVALVLMETLNDIGAVEFFGVRTLTVAVYDTWLDRNSLAGAAQIACVMLLFVFALLIIERALRAGRRFHHTTGKYRDLREDSLPRLARAAGERRLRLARAVRLRAAGRGAAARCARACGGGFGAGVLGGRAEQPHARRGGGGARRRLRRGARLRAAADALAADPGGEHAARHQLCDPRHRARHRPAHSAGGPRQFPRRADAVAVRGVHGAGAVGHRLRHRARLHDPLPRRLARRGGGRA